MEATHFINSSELERNYKVYSPSEKISSTPVQHDDIQRNNDGTIDYGYYEKETRALRADAIGEMFAFIRNYFVK